MNDYAHLRHVLDQTETKLRNMHRRAQKAEGQRDRARFVVELWEQTLANDQRKVAFWLVLKVLAEIRKGLK